MLDTFEINRLKAQLSNHALYQCITTVEDLKRFMQCHVFCTWDFMSLLKSLQIQLTSTSIPWVPPKHLALARLINEIVLDEETDLIHGQPVSHFELYCQAMAEAGCSMAPIKKFIGDIERQVPVTSALERADLPLPVQSFVNTTFELIEKPLEVQAAVFLHGREDIIPGIFLEIVRRLEAQGLDCPSFLTYLNRHIEIDGDKHGPLAEKLVAELLENKPELLQEVQGSVEKAIKARIRLWDFLLPPATSSRLA